ncbi:MAG: hypothetical protein IJB31_02210 [Akkermansia sp.]|nr:hypothetical protein [Akkermansia sp.]
MKNFFLSLVVAALFGMPFATARDATSVQVSVKHQPGKPVAAQKVALHSAQNMNVEGIMESHKTGGWHVVNIPLTVEGYCKKKDSNGSPLPVHYIPSLTVKVYLLFKCQDEKAKDPAALLLSKELNYVNIPVVKEGKKSGVRENEIYAGVFISPADAWKINEKAKAELSGALVAYAVEATFNGANCMNSDKAKFPQAYVVDKKLEREWNLDGKWWGRTSNDRGASLRSVMETPFAYSFAAFYPESAPLVADTTPGAASTTPTSTDSASATSTETPSETADSATPAEDSTGADADADDSGASKKRSKGKRRSRRGSSL